MKKGHRRQPRNQSHNQSHNLFHPPSGTLLTGASTAFSTKHETSDRHSHHYIRQLGTSNRRRILQRSTRYTLFQGSHTLLLCGSRGRLAGLVQLLSTGDRMCFQKLPVLILCSMAAEVLGIFTEFVEPPNSICQQGQL